MTFNRPFSNTNPTGTLVQRTFGTEYKTVQTVFEHLEYIKQVWNSLVDISEVNAISRTLHDVALLEQHIKKIGDYIDEVIQFNDSVEYMTNNYPAITSVLEYLNKFNTFFKECQRDMMEYKSYHYEFVNSITTVLDKFAQDKMIQLQKEYERHSKQLKHYVDSIECRLAHIEKQLEAQNIIKETITMKDIVALKTTDIVTKAIELAFEEPNEVGVLVNKAKDYIKYSEQTFGNDESLNLQRLNKAFQLNEEYWVIDE